MRAAPLHGRSPQAGPPRQPPSSTPPGWGAAGSYGSRLKTNEPRSSATVRPPSRTGRRTSPGVVAVEPDPRPVADAPGTARRARRRAARPGRAGRRRAAAGRTAYVPQYQVPTSSSAASSTLGERRPRRDDARLGGAHRRLQVADERRRPGRWWRCTARPCRGPRRGRRTPTRGSPASSRRARPACGRPTRTTCSPRPYADQPVADGSTPAGEAISSSVSARQHVAGVAEQERREAAEVGRASPTAARRRPSRRRPPPARAAARRPTGARPSPAPRGRRDAASCGSCRAAAAPRRGRRRPRTGRGRGPAARRARRSRGWSSGTGGRRRAAGRPAPSCSAKASHGCPGTRSHHGPGLSERRPAVWDSSCPTVRAPNGVPGHVALERVVEVEPALVAQAQDRHRGDRLADRPEPVLHVGVRLLHRADAGRPGQRRRRGRPRRSGTARGWCAGRGRCGRAARGRWLEQRSGRSSGRHAHDRSRAAGQSRPAALSER